MSEQDRAKRLTDLLVHVVCHKSCVGYVIALVDDHVQSITCLVCGMTSFSTADVANKYCGACHVFHDERLAALHLKEGGSHG